MEIHLEELDLLECIRSEAEDLPELQVLPTDAANVKLEKSETAEKEKEEREMQVGACS